MTATEQPEDSNWNFVRMELHVSYRRPFAENAACFVRSFGPGRMTFAEAHAAVGDELWVYADVDPAEFVRDWNAALTEVDCASMPYYWGLYQHGPHIREGADAVTERLRSVGVPIRSTPEEAP
jgi:hypothetical protein